MQPHVVGFADCGEGSEGVEGAEDGSAGCGIEEKWCFALTFTLHNQSFKLRRYHTTEGVDGYADDGRGTQAVEVCCFFDGVVSVGGGEDCEF